MGMRRFQQYLFQVVHFTVKAFSAVHIAGYKKDCGKRVYIKKLAESFFFRRNAIEADVAVISARQFPVRSNNPEIFCQVTPENFFYYSVVSSYKNILHSLFCLLIMLLINNK